MNYFVQSLVALTFFNTIIVLFVLFGNFINLFPHLSLFQLLCCLRNYHFSFSLVMKIYFNFIFHLSKLLFYHLVYAITLDIKFHSVTGFPAGFIQKKPLQSSCYLHKSLHSLVLTHFRGTQHQLKPHLFTDA